MTNQGTSKSFGESSKLKTSGGEVDIYPLSQLSKQGVGHVEKLPFSIRVLLENVLRHNDGYLVKDEDVTRLAAWNAKAPAQVELAFMPYRVLLQDFTGVPAVVDLAAMRSAMKRMGGDPRKINPLVPVDLVIDHSVQVDAFGSSAALGINADLEFSRNRERYEFLRWGQQAFDRFRVVPPATGIVHQVNLEYLAPVVGTWQQNGRTIALPDTLVGTDSHTTMINGLGVVGWGVGGIEAEAVMLGQPIYMLTPQVIGFKLNGRLPEGTTATDLVLTVTQMLRAKGVVDKFVEFYGDGLAELSLADRATIANMAPEYGATMGFFPIDEQTLAYMRQTGRSEQQIDLVERYAKEQGLFRTAKTPDPVFTDTLVLELSTIEPSLAGPKRPQDRVRLSDMKPAFQAALKKPVNERGYGMGPDDLRRSSTFGSNGNSYEMSHGSVVIAAITSCTNTSNPSVMVAAGLLAKNAVAKGLKVKPHVKTSLAPGSRVVTEYFNHAGLTEPLEALGFHTVGYGCTTCIGNSGPLPEPVAKAVEENKLVAAAVLSGNRNFEGRVHPHVKANYLASPPLVVAYALAGRVDIDMATEPLGYDASGKGVFLRDIWPTQKDVQTVVGEQVTPELFRQEYKNVLDGNEKWNAIKVGKGEAYDWNPDSTYIQEPPFFQELSPEPAPLSDIQGARVLAMLGDSVTTDHISPAGSIAATSPAGRYLQELGVTPKDFNSYGSRRGNDRVMTRGTFANVRLRNLLVPSTEGGVTLYMPAPASSGHSEPAAHARANAAAAKHQAGAASSAVAEGEQMSIYDAAVKYREDGTPLIILAGAEYGTGSSRDWAAKGTLLLGVKAVIAVSFERIHRSNLVGMGVLPLEFKKGQTRETLGLNGDELYTITGVCEGMRPGQDIQVVAADPTGIAPPKKFMTTLRIDTPVEMDYYRHGGILPMVLRRLAGS